MTKGTIEIPALDKEGWLIERLKDVTSTEVSALYGLSPYITEFELFHQKREKLIVRIEENERMKWGKRLEHEIALAAAAEKGYEIEKMDVYMRDVDARMGSSFDYKIIASPDHLTPGILEIKNVSGIQYAQKWIDDGHGNIEAPEHIELQIQHQMAVSGYSWCCLAALVGGHTLKTAIRKSKNAIRADLRAKVSEFWRKVDANEAPKPDYIKDYRYIINELRRNAINGLVTRADEELEKLIMNYDRLTSQIGAFDKLKKKCKAEILDRVGEASKIISQHGYINCSMTREVPGTLVTPDMLGQTIGGRKSYRNFRFNKKGS